MTRRMIDSSMWSNENFAALPAMARLLQIGLINHADDQGRMKANPLYLAKEIFPYDRVTPTSIAKWLDLIASNGTIILYVVDGKQYAQLTKWWEYQSLQYASPSDYPPPANWKDRIRRTATKGFIATYNWTLTNGVTVEDTCDERGKPLGAKPPQLDKLSKPDTDDSNSQPAPIDSPVDSPESSPEPAIELNLIEDQLNSTNEEEERPAAPPPPAAAVTNPDAVRVWAKWNANMPGVKTPVIVDSVNSLLDDYSAAEIEEAITIACKRNIRTLSYIQGILVKGVFKDAPKPVGGDYRPSNASHNRQAVTNVFAKLRAQQGGNGHG